MKEPVIYTSERKADTHLTLNSCGDRLLDDNDIVTLREKGRVDYGIQYIAEGICYCEDNGTTHTVPAGNVILYFPSVRQHYYFKKQDNSHLLWAHCTGKACEMLNPVKSDTAVIVKIADTKEFERVFKRMTAAYHHKEPYFQSVCDGYMQVILSLIMKNTVDLDKTAEKPSNDNIEKIIAYMHIHFNEQIDLGRYAKMCFVSRDRFMHMFKEYTGVSPYHYQLNIRMDKAVEMLTYSSVSINEVAQAVGFKDCSYFCRIFKKITGHSPSYFRK